jgi:hypothetical protein
MFGNLNISDDQAKSQINNFWSYLDELAEKNPEEYQKFISQQLKTGLQNNQHLVNKDNKDNSNNTQQPAIDKAIKVTPYISLRYKLSKIKEGLPVNKNDKIKIHERQSINEIPKILFSYDFQSQAFGKEVIEDPKIYLNIVCSDKYFLPVDEHNQQLKNPQDDSTWKYIPTQFRYNGKKSSMSGHTVEFYDVVIHSIIADKMKKSDEMLKSILAYISRKFSMYLENKYELFFKNVKILQKKYKSTKPTPDDFFLDKEKVAEVRQPVTNKEEPIISKNFMDLEENKIKIPNKSENFTNTNTFYNLPKETANKKTKKQEPVKKILIEEIKKLKKIPIKKTILSPNEMEVKFDLSEFDEYELETVDFDLLISKDAIKLNIEQLERGIDYEPIDMALNFNLDIVRMETAVFDKINKALKLILIKL